MKYVYICVITCTSLSLFCADSLDNFDNPRNTMTSQRFVIELLSPTDLELRHNIKMVEKYSKRASKNLFAQAEAGSNWAMSELAKKTDHDDVPPIVPMYWWSEIAQRIASMSPTPPESRKRKRSAENQLDITFKYFLLTREYDVKKAAKNRAWRDLKKSTACCVTLAAVNLHFRMAQRSSYLLFHSI